MSREIIIALIAAAAVVLAPVAGELVKAAVSVDGCPCGQDAPERSEGAD